MTIGGWIVFGLLAVFILAIGGLIISGIDTYSTLGKVGIFITIAVCIILIFVTLAGFKWYFNNTESGLRALKSQESELSGGLNRTVTVYGYSGEEIRSWTGKFDVTENDQETWFDIDGRRVIIQGGIVINEEQEG